MNEAGRPSLTFRDSCGVALGAGLMIFLSEWSGYHRGCSACSPRRLGEIWWHFPLEVVAAFGAVHFLRLLGRFRDRAVPQWVLYALLAVALGCVAATVVFLVRS